MERFVAQRFMKNGNTQDYEGEYDPKTERYYLVFGNVKIRERMRLIDGKRCVGIANSARCGKIKDIPEKLDINKLFVKIKDC